MRGADLEDNKSMEEALKRKAVGTKFLLVIDEYTKRDKSTGYNYDLEEYTMQPVNVEEIEDSDLPF